MTLVTVTQGRGWCELDVCENRVVPQDVAIIGGTSVCSPCLLGLGDGVERSELVRVESNAEDRLQAAIDSSDERIEELVRKLKDTVIGS